MPEISYHRPQSIYRSIWTLNCRGRTRDSGPPLYVRDLRSATRAEPSRAEQNASQLQAEQRAETELAGASGLRFTPARRRRGPVFAVLQVVATI
jgi:hypothetical protein